MKVKVLKNFTDKESGKFKMEGMEYEFSSERAKELKEMGYVEILEPIKRELTKKTLEKREPRKSIAKK